MDRGFVRPLAFLFLVWFCPARAGVPDPGLCNGISAAASGPLASVRIASGLVRPIFAISPPGDSTRLFVVEQDGRIRLLKNGVLQPTYFLDIAGITRSPADGGGSEQGLLGLAFHPGYATNGWFFVYHTDASGTTNVVVRYDRSAFDPDVADPTSRQVVISFAHPAFDNHNGGMIAFGPDGYLTIGTGDGGDGCDPTGNAQNPASLLGKLLRINVDALPYTIPPSNPFVGQGAYRPEIWATGMRNPWRFSFDRATGDLYIGDVGQDQWEEVDFAPAPLVGGRNYGWDSYEATRCPNPSCGSQGSCSLASYLAPVLEYGHGPSCSVTGGYVYRGCRMPALRGTYFYSDYCSAFLRSFEILGNVATHQVDHTAELAPGGGLDISSVSSFGEDARGELLIVDRNGEVFAVVPVLASLEVSGSGATTFRLNKPDWTWEDLQAMSYVRVSSYRVYRETDAVGPFSCVHQGSSPSWAGGDPSTPPSGSVYFYVVTAVNAAGQETSPGTGSGGSTRLLSASACP